MVTSPANEAMGPSPPGVTAAVKAPERAGVGVEHEVDADLGRHGVSGAVVDRVGHLAVGELLLASEVGLVPQEPQLAVLLDVLRLVDEAWVPTAIRELFREEGIVAEGAGAVEQRVRERTDFPGARGVGIGSPEQAREAAALDVDYIAASHLSDAAEKAVAAVKGVAS